MGFSVSLRPKPYAEFWILTPEFGFPFDDTSRGGYLPLAGEPIAGC